jgi:hypothetical protein
MRRAGTPERNAFYVLQGISIDCIAAQASLMKKLALGCWKKMMNPTHQA